MNSKELARLVDDLTRVQILLMQKRRDHNGQVLEHEDIDEIQVTIEILQNLIIEPNYIWRNKKS
jgi:hypothetical protein